jgi:hypothetical protein
MADKGTHGEPILPEWLAIFDEAGADAWTTWNGKSLRGVALLGQTPGPRCRRPIRQDLGESHETMPADDCREPSAAALSASALGLWQMRNSPAALSSYVRSSPLACGGYA